ncbi:MAG: HNH endonuclease [Candidatus Daviesbacteria bacterium]|nr:HNH endonuclease [Candidatus Daviesbacteria bacterium]
MKSCYLCGSTENLTKDHIPPKNLFPTPKPKNLITVWCCKKCNEKFSLIDESFRVFTSSVINRSQSGTRIWNEKVMQSSFKRSPKLKTATIKSLVLIETEINGIKVQETGMTYPIKKTKAYLVRLTKGFTRYFNPEIDLSDAEFKVSNIIPNQQIVDMLDAKYFYVERGDGVFRMWRMFVKDKGAESLWVYVFYDGLMFMIKVN